MSHSRARFVKTATHYQDYPVVRNEHGRILPEIAVAGRSNVGKSSLLNHLFESERLVKTSSTPGKTQTINFFSWNDIAFADLPGYGYAQVPLALKKTWGPMIQSYLEKRETLKVILFLLDIRRIPNEDDLRLMDWIVHSQRATILVLTKVDKVKQSEKVANTKKILEAFQVENLNYTYYSVPKSRGRKELIATMHEALKDEDAI